MCQVKITEWAKINNMCINVAKTKYQVYIIKHSADRQKNLKFEINNKQIEYAEENKYLSTALDKKLTIKDHTKNVTQTEVIF